MWLVFFINGLKSVVMGWDEAAVFYQRIKIRWYNMGRGYASL
jgi:hypothetical protein